MGVDLELEEPVKVVRCEFGVGAFLEMDIVAERLPNMESSLCDSLSCWVEERILVEHCFSALEFRYGSEYSCLVMCSSLCILSGSIRSSRASGTVVRA